jgi:uncharacterized phiE125 gp8 family phage protein
MTYPTNTDLKAYLAITGSSEDSLLTAIVNAARGFVERQTGRNFVSGAAAERKFPLLPGFVDGWRVVLTTKGMDFVSVSAVVNGDGAVIPSSAYVLLPVGAAADGRPYFQIMLLPETGEYWRGPGLIAVTAAWGFSTSCPAAIFEAILELGANMYRRRMSGAAGSVQQVGAQGLIVHTGDIPQTVGGVLAQYRRW